MKKLRRLLGYYSAFLLFVMIVLWTAYKAHLHMANNPESYGQQHMAATK